MRESYEERGYDARRRQRVRRSSGNEYARIMQGRTEDEDWEDDWEEDLEEETVPKRRRGQEGRGNRSVHRQEESAGKRSSYGSHKRKKSSHKALKILLAVLVLVAGFFFVKNLMTGKNWTVAVFGVDSREGKLERGTNSDVIMVANINRKTGEVKLVSVYRDTYLKINDEGEYHKINEAYAQGGHEQAVKALEENPAQDFLGNLYMSLDFGSGWSGQFFTPWHVAEFMAQIGLANGVVFSELEKQG